MRAASTVEVIEELSTGVHLAEAPMRPMTPRSSMKWRALPAHLAADLRRLETMLPPSTLEIPMNGTVAVHGTLELARSGWTTQALALGWKDHDLFGIGPVSSDELSGLAGRLAGRRRG